MAKPDKPHRPWIGIPTRYHDKTEMVGQIRHYLDAVVWAGGVPLLIPATDSRGYLQDYLERLDGILLPGSPTDIDPRHYGQQPEPRLGKLYPERDALDFALLEHGDKAGLPVLGICFGVQSLNVFRGGTLIQDIPSGVPAAIEHESKGTKPSEFTHHAVRFDKDSRLARLAGSEAGEVVSDHHQSIRDVGRDLRVVARAPDGVIEAVEDPTGRFILGIQWHPERGWAEDALSCAIFAAFVREAAESHSVGHPV